MSDRTASPGRITMDGLHIFAAPGVRLWLLAAAIRLLAVLPFLAFPIALDDMYQYDMLARSLANGDGYRWYSRADIEPLWPYLSSFLSLEKDDFPPDGLVTAFRSPGYPFFLAGVYLVSSAAGRFAAARVAQALLTALMAPLAMALGRRAGLTPRQAWWAGLLAALYPILLFYPVGLASENIFIPLTALGLLLLLRAREKPSVRRGVLVGLVLGAAVLTRSILGLFVVAAAVWLAWNPSARRSAAAMLAAAALVCLPWCVRNTIVMQRPAFIENSLGFNLWIGYHPEGSGEFVSKIAIRAMGIMDDAERDAFTMRQAVGFIRADPLEAARRVLPRAVGFFGPEDREFTYLYGNGFMGNIPQPWPTAIYLLLVVPWMLVMGLSPLGLRLAPGADAPGRDAAGLAALFIVFYTLPHLLILAEPRFHLVLVPVLLPFAVLGWANRGLLLDRLYNLREHRAPADWALRAAVLALLLAWAFAAVARVDWLPVLLGPDRAKTLWYY